MRASRISCFILAAVVFSSQAAFSDTPAPPAVLSLADAYVESLPQHKTTQEGINARAGFLGSFLNGFRVGPSGRMSGGAEANRQGFKAGQEYRAANEGKLKEIMEGFGCTATEATGVWIGNSEHFARFQPDTRPEERWWVQEMGDTKHLNAVGEPQGARQPRSNGTAVRLAGFRRPMQGGFASHEFFATTITYLPLE